MRRLFLQSLIASCAASAVRSPLAQPAWDGPMLDAQNSRLVRAWIVRLVSAQIQLGPSPRWNHRDCAGLLRFALAEALREHGVAWKRANGLLSVPVPPELAISAEQRNLLRQRWRLSDGTTAAFASAIDIVQANCSYLGKDWQRAQPADLFFYDHGDEQHVMIWMGQHVAYHTGSSTPQDNGLRAVPISALMHWRDTRWQPRKDNPNFAGVYRLALLSR